MFSDFKLRNTSTLCLMIILLSALTLTSCSESQTVGNSNQNSNVNKNSSTNKNSNSETTEDTREFRRAQAAHHFTIPPTTDGGGVMHLKVDETKKELGITLLNEVAILLIPLKYSVTVESVEFAIYSDEKMVFSIPASTTRNSRTFPPLERQDANFVGYLFELDPQKIAEGNRYFVSGNTIRVIPQIKRENGADATFYLVNKNSEVERGKQTR